MLFKFIDIYRIFIFAKISDYCFFTRFQGVLVKEVIWTRSIPDTKDVS